jgi:hypothetical protein
MSSNEESAVVSDTKLESEPEHPVLRPQRPPPPPPTQSEPSTPIESTTISSECIYLFISYSYFIYNSSREYTSTYGNN